MIIKYNRNKRMIRKYLNQIQAEIIEAMSILDIINYQ